MGDIVYVCVYAVVMGIKGRRVHMIEEISETIISFQRGKICLCMIVNVNIPNYYFA